MSLVRLSWLGAHGRALWSSRFLVGDEESQAFVHRDELSRSYGEAHAGEPGEEPYCSSSPETNEERQAEGFHRGSPDGTCPKITTWEAGWNVTNAIQVSGSNGLILAMDKMIYTKSAQHDTMQFGFSLNQIWSDKDNCAYIYLLSINTNNTV